MNIYLAESLGWDLSPGIKNLSPGMKILVCTSMKMTPVKNNARMLQRDATGISRYTARTYNTMDDLRDY